MREFWLVSVLFTFLYSKEKNILILLSFTDLSLAVLLMHSNNPPSTVLHVRPVHTEPTGMHDYQSRDTWVLDTWLRPWVFSAQPDLLRAPARVKIRACVSLIFCSLCISFNVGLDVLGPSDGEEVLEVATTSEAPAQQF